MQYNALKLSPALAFIETDACILTNKTTQEILWNDEKVKKKKKKGGSVGQIYSEY